MKKYSILLAAMLVICRPALAAVPPAEKLLPDDTLVVLTAPDFQKVLTIYSNSPQTQLWNDPALQAFRTKLTDKFKSVVIAPLEHDLGIHFDDYTSLPQGQITLALVQDGWQGKDNDPQDPALVLLVDTKDKSAQLKTDLADLKKKWADAGKTIKTEKIRDVDFSAITISADDLPKALRPADPGTGDAPDATTTKPADAANHPKTMIYIGQADSLLIVANSAKVIGKILTAMSGGGITTLSEVPAFAANQNTLFRDAPIYGWVNFHPLVAIMKQSIPAPPAGDSSTPSGDKIVAALGLEGLKSAAFAGVYSDDGAQLNFQLTVPEDARSGLLKMIAWEAKDSSPPPFVPADAIKFDRYRIDGAKSWENLRKLINDLSPQSLGAVDFMLNSAEASAREKNPDFDIKKDFFGNLGDDFISYQKNPKGETPADLATPPAIVLVGSPNPTQLGTALNALLALAGPQGPPKEREFLGHKIYSVPLPFLSLAMGPAASPSAPPPTLSYAASGSYLALSLEDSILEEYLRGSSADNARSLGDTPGLSAAKQRISDSGTSFFTYQNDAEMMRAYLKNARSGTGANDLESYFEIFTMATGAGANLKFSDWVDLSLLPSYDQISKYFAFTVAAGGPTPDGLELKVFSPTPPRLKK